MFDDTTGCNPETEGFVIVHPNAQDLKRWVVNISSTPTKLDTSMRVEINTTGWHVLLVASCTAVNIVLDGVVEWMNPYGYLPGDQYSFLPVIFFLKFIQCLI